MNVVNARAECGRKNLGQKGKSNKSCVPATDIYASEPFYTPVLSGLDDDDDDRERER